MTVSELIRKLEHMPQEAEVYSMYDGAASNDVDFVWRSRSGDVVLSPCNQMVYDTDDRPITAPTQEEDEFWSTPKSKDGTYSETIIE